MGSGRSVKKSLFISFIVMLYFPSYSSPVRSGYERGNGGNFLLCNDKSTVGKGVFSLDRIEGENLYGRQTSKSLASISDENDILQHILEQLAVVSPSRASMYQKWHREMLENRIFVKDQQIHPLNDGELILVPDGCTVKQGAVFVANSAQQVQFYFDEDLWKTASALDRASLMLHELVYREARLIENNHVNSMASRHLVGWLLLHFDKLNQEAMIQKIKDVGFCLADYKGIALSMTFYSKRNGLIEAPVLMYPGSNQIWKAVLYHSFTLHFNDKSSFQRHCRSVPNEYGSFTDWVEFYPSGQIKNIVFSEPLLLESPDKCTYFNGDNFLQFDISGNLIRSALVETPFLLDFKK